MGDLHSQQMRELLSQIETQRQSAVAAQQQLETVRQQSEQHEQELQCALRNSQLARDGLLERVKQLQQELTAAQTGQSTHDSSEVPASETEAQAQVRALRAQLAALNADNQNAKSDADKVKR